MQRLQEQTNQSHIFNPLPLRLSLSPTPSSFTFHIYTLLHPFIPPSSSTAPPQSQLSPQHPLQSINFLSLVIAPLTNRLYQQKELSKVLNAGATLMVAASSSISPIALNDVSTGLLFSTFSSDLLVIRLLDEKWRCVSRGFGAALSPYSQ